MWSSTNKVIATAVGLALAASMSACGSSDKAGANGPIVVGRLLPLTGPLAGSGQRVADGAEIARQLVNENGGINGTQVEYKNVDAPTDEAARQGAERLVNEGTDIVLGTFGSSLALAAIPVVTREKGLYWETGASAMAITSGEYKNVFRVSDTAGDIGTGAIEFTANTLAKRLGRDPSSLKIGWAGVKNSYGEDVKNGVKSATAKHNMSMVLESAYPVNSTDLSSVALQIRNAAPDVLVLTSYDADAAALGRALRAVGVTPPVIIGSGAGHVDPSWIEAMGGDGNGVFNVGFSSQLNKAALSTEAQKQYATFQERFAKDHGGKEPGAFDVNGFVGAMALFDTMRKAKNATPDAVAAAAVSADLPSRSNIDGSGLKFNENGQNERGLMLVTQWQGGKVVPVYPTDLQLAEPTDVPLPEWGKQR